MLHPKAPPRKKLKKKFLDMQNKQSIEARNLTISPDS